MAAAAGSKYEECPEWWRQVSVAASSSALYGISGITDGPQAWLPQGGLLTGQAME